MIIAPPFVKLCKDFIPPIAMLRSWAGEVLQIIVGLNVHLLSSGLSHGINAWTTMVTTPMCEKKAGGGEQT